MLLRTTTLYKEVFLQKIVLVLKTKHMKYSTGLLLLSIVCFSCKAQTFNNELSEREYEVLSALINQNNNYKDTFYLNKFIGQKKYPIRFRKNYEREVFFYKKADSICNNSKDLLELKLFCPSAYYRKEYLNLFSEKDLNYFEDTYKGEFNSSFIDLKKIPNLSPIVKEHSKEYYDRLNQNGANDSSLHKQFPSLEIHGIYFSKNNQIVVIAHSMILEKFGSRLKYSVIKKEEGVWWRLIGDLSR